MNKPITVQYAFKKDGKGERHGAPAERLLAAQARKNNAMPFGARPPGMRGPAYMPGQFAGALAQAPAAPGAPAAAPGIPPALPAGFAPGQVVGIPPPPPAGAPMYSQHQQMAPGMMMQPQLGMPPQGFVPQPPGFGPPQGYQMMPPPPQGYPMPGPPGMGMQPPPAFLTGANAM